MSDKPLTAIRMRDEKHGHTQWINVGPLAASKIAALVQAAWREPAVRYDDGTAITAVSYTTRQA